MIGNEPTEVLETVPDTELPEGEVLGVDVVAAQTAPADPGELVDHRAGPTQKDVSALVSVTEVRLQVCDGPQLVVTTDGVVEAAVWPADGGHGSGVKSCAIRRVSRPSARTVRRKLPSSPAPARLNGCSCQSRPLTRRKTNWPAAAVGGVGLNRSWPHPYHK